MREIKFRSFVKKDKAMVSDVRIGSSLNDCLKSDSVIFMQYTGLKDANGVEIYEGDFVEDHNGVGVVEYDEKYAAFRVCYGAGIGKWFYDYNLKCERESIKVVGNIYQGKELSNG